ncbi:MAG: insulinase family protein [Alphaproteobacteria bacterium]|nr:insulinase family protein [Alphaproteobacteria bacterium]
MRLVVLILALSMLPFQCMAAIYQQFTLANGMQVVVIPNHRVPVVTHMVWYKVGAKDEEVGKSGIAHFLEHLMFKGTEKLKPGEFSSIIAKNGGNDNAFTSQDFTAYFQTISKDKLLLVMGLEAERMTKLKLSDDEIKKEREVVLEERRTRTENEPSAMLMEQMKAALYQNHPYGRPIIGWSHEIKQLSPSEIQSFYHLHYAPNKAILVVSGDITAEELRPLAEATYGKVPAAKPNVAKNITEPPHIAPIHVTYTDEKVKQAEYMMYFLAPGQRSVGKENAYALTVLAHILGGGETSRLYQSLVVNQKVAASASVFYDDVSTFDTVFGMYVIPHPETSLAELEKALRKQLDLIVDKGVTSEELERAKTVIRAQSIYDRDSSKGMAFAFGEAMVVGLSPDYVETLPDKMNAVTAKQVQDAARLVFKPQQSVVGVLLPKQQDAKADKKPVSSPKQSTARGKI